MADFATALATASQALKLVNDLAFDAAALKSKIADLNMALADLKSTLIDAKEEIAAKQTEIDRLNALLKRHEEESPRSNEP